ncbi:hypothetical protein GGTG_05328 [Gaeumannomyces tritici R3-111a-1]|uniref:Uncharacterized protein n=1 Tax=Gaeumannomyces tritici (strain R3-111a-1) TaxID=644352 RepID=J3NVL3_GAET3|nr:hypothetical protein GGTG_05328 [Gaeumannomyces tritici R3-111a-1]EJT75391.1 hypothetical protein GGTG_05328 [Gaeumannomyces tritici R3-111a-1]
MVLGNDLEARLPACTQAVCAYPHLPPTPAATHPPAPEPADTGQTAANPHKNDGSVPPRRVPPAIRKPQRPTLVVVAFVPFAGRRRRCRTQSALCATHPS